MVKKKVVVVEEEVEIANNVGNGRVDDGCRASNVFPQEALQRSSPSKRPSVVHGDHLQFTRPSASATSEHRRQLRPPPSAASSWRQRLHGDIFFGIFHVDFWGIDLVVTSISLGGRIQKTPWWIKTGKNVDKKQLRNKWDNMKKDWKVYDRLMRLETGIGGTRSLINASLKWWEEKIKVRLTSLFT
ncbi:hypothetical protein OSB04_017197 [Centaurea solstitialis]|uniref:Uncharacterized protein n=1 Tax=Centaurea solstitialis TaxID=347529 RepID=A0AA38TKJ7_9ASTR|nr:hypothetical protein OSB04_017197 [Centaurea solstitialis]